MWHLVQFLEDKVWYVCTSSKVRKNSKNKESVKCKWLDQRWYAAVIYETSDDKASLEEAAKMRNQQLKCHNTVLLTQTNNNNTFEQAGRPTIVVEQEKEPDDTALKTSEDRKIERKTKSCNLTRVGRIELHQSTENKMNLKETLLPNNSTPIIDEPKTTEVKRTWRKLCNVALDNELYSATQNINNNDSKTIGADLSNIDSNTDVLLQVEQQQPCNTSPRTILTDLTNANCSRSILVGTDSSIDNNLCDNSRMRSVLDDSESINYTIENFYSDDDATNIQTVFRFEPSDPDYADAAMKSPYGNKSHSSDSEINLPSGKNKCSHVAEIDRPHKMPLSSTRTKFTQVTYDSSDKTEPGPFEKECPAYEPDLSEFSPESQSSENSGIQIEDVLKNFSQNGPQGLEPANSNENYSQEPQSLAASDQLKETESAEENVIDMPVLPVATVSRRSGKRTWDKKFLCIYCSKLFAKLPRHFYKSHADELEVARILSLEKTSKERQKRINELRNKGVFIRNKNAIRQGEGKIEPKRRTSPDKQKYVSGYLPCPHCFQMFSKKYLFRHVRICEFRPTNSPDLALKRNRCLRTNSYLMLPVGLATSSRFRECVLAKMTEDDVFKIIRNDYLILLFGEYEFKRLGHDARYHRTIIDRCRELGRLVLTAKKLQPNIKNLIQLLDPSMYKVFRDAAMVVAGYNSTTGVFKVPTLILKIGFSIKKCIAILKGEYLEDDILRSNVPKLEAFSEIMNCRWNAEVTSHAYRNLSERKWNAPKRIPITKDIQLLHTFLKEESVKFSQILNKGPNEVAFCGLTEVTLLSIIILNRRRVGEVQYMLLRDYMKAKSADTEADIFNTLTDAEKILTQSLVRLVIKGKRGRGVPVLLTQDMQEHIELLNSMRQQCGINPNNTYLFASLKHTSGHYRACSLLNSFARSAGCQYPQTISSTQLRKHVATSMQLLNLKENELDSLAQFMGHDIKVHRNYYRLADETVQLAKISKILVNLGKGSLAEMKGKSLDEITVEDDIIEENDKDNSDENDKDDSVEQAGNSNNKKRPMVEVDRIQKRQEKKRKVEANEKHMINLRNKKVSVRKPWTEQEIRITMGKFQNYLSMRRLPGKKEIEQLISENKKVLTGRTWTNVKDFLYNKLKKQAV